MATEGGAFHSLRLLCVITEVKQVEDSSKVDPNFQDECKKNLHVNTLHLCNICHLYHINESMLHIIMSFVECVWLNGRTLA